MMPRVIKHTLPAVHLAPAYDASVDAARILSMNMFVMVGEIEGYPVADIRALAGQLGISLFYPDSSDRRSKGVLVACVFEYVRGVQREA